MAAGAMVTLEPVPTAVPPHELLYHFQLAPVPSVPPLTLKVVVLPKQMVVVPVIAVAGNEVSPTVTVTLRQMVVLQVPSARTKYVVFVEGETVMLFPVPSAVPPHDPLYHFQLAPTPKLPPLTEMVTAFPKHTVVEPLIEVAGTEVS